MINPGRMTSIPTSSSVGMGGETRGGLSKQIFAVDGFTITLGMVLALVLVFLIWQTFFAKRRR